MKKHNTFIMCTVLGILLTGCGNVTDKADDTSNQTSTLAATSEAAATAVETAVPSTSASAVTDTEKTQTSSADGTSSDKDAETVSSSSTQEYYKATDPGSCGLSIASLSGTWTNANDPSDKMTVTSGSYIYEGRFDAGSASGYIELSYTENPDGTQKMWYTFYNDDGSLWNAFEVTGEIPLNDLYSGGQNALHYVYDNNVIPPVPETSNGGFLEPAELPASGVSVAALSGVWTNADNSADTITITENGSFTVINAGDTITSGNIKIMYTFNSDNTEKYWYVFYQNDGYVWNAFDITGEIPLCDLYASQSDYLHYTRS